MRWPGSVYRSRPSEPKGATICQGNLAGEEGGRSEFPLGEGGGRVATVLGKGALPCLKDYPVGGWGRETAGIFEIPGWIFPIPDRAKLERANR